MSDGIVETCLSRVKDSIDAIIADLAPEGRASSRELSLAVTNLQQARMWVNEHQKHEVAGGGSVSGRAS